VHNFLLFISIDKALKSSGFFAADKYFLKIIGENVFLFKDKGYICRAFE
jgi:hypothetical protein